MAEDILDALGPALTRWTMGAGAAAGAPAAWRAALGDDAAEAELRLLALSSQFLAVAVVAEPQGALRALPDLPALALPSLPATLRPLVQRVMQPGQAQMRRYLPHFLAARGWVTHPGDWMPAAHDDDAPEAYAPWRDWSAAAASGEAVSTRSAAALTVENWDDHWPAERKVALAELRLRDPAAARGVLEAKLAGEGADARLRLLGVMENDLSEGDIAFLEAVAAGDRAPKVKALAASLLARLGRSDAGGEDIAELASFLALHTKGLLRRTRVIQFLNQKTSAQIQRRGVLFEQADFAAFAGALGLDGDALLDAWPWNADPRADTALLAMIARSGSDAIVIRAAGDVVEQAGVGLGALALLTPRLSPGQRAQTAAGLLQSADASFALALEVARGVARIDDPLATPAGRQLLELLARPEARPGDGTDELLALGLLASRAGAQRTLERLANAGLLQADPRLDTIRLNAALDDQGGME